jgi:hypothetical protein
MYVSSAQAPAGVVHEGLSNACLDARVGPSVGTSGRRLESTTPCSKAYPTRVAEGPSTTLGMTRPVPEPKSIP